LRGGKYFFFPVDLGQSHHRSSTEFIGADVFAFQNNFFTTTTTVSHHCQGAFYVGSKNIQN